MVTGFGCAMKQEARPYTDCVAGKLDMSFAIRPSADLAPMRWAERSTRSLVSATSDGRRQIGAIASAQNALTADFGWCLGAPQRKRTIDWCWIFG
jgi:hypothetical protein